MEDSFGSDLSQSIRYSHYYPFFPVNLPGPQMRNLPMIKFYTL